MPKYLIYVYTHAAASSYSYLLCAYSYRNAQKRAREAAQADFIEKTTIHSVATGRSWHTFWPRFKGA